MSTYNEDLDRNNVPKWRSFMDATRFREVGPASVGTPPKQSYKSLQNLVQELEETNSLSVACDLVSNAFTVGVWDIANAAAQKIVDSKHATPLAQEVAQFYLRQEKHPKGAFQSLYGSTDPSSLNHSIRETRLRLSQFPNNPLLWSGLSLMYTINGNRYKARRAMLTAIQLAPGDRFVLRSASRLFLHLDEIEEAHRVLRNAPNLRNDPWLLASELAYASITNKTSQHVKRAIFLAESEKFSSFDLSELWLSLATLEARSGNMRKARRFCRSGLSDPAENAIAQAAWLDRNLGGINWVRETQHASFTSNEAVAWTRYADFAWKESLHYAVNWQREQPFSSRPALLGSYVAMAALDDYALAEKIAKQAIVCNPAKSGLQNNLIVALAKQGKIDEAIKVLAEVRWADADDRAKTCLTASVGLVNFRSGRVDEGRRLYIKAREMAIAKGFDDLRRMATLYLLMEEVNAKQLVPPRQFTEAIEAARGLNNGLGQKFIESVERIQADYSRQQLFFDSQGARIENRPLID